MPRKAAKGKGKEPAQPRGRAAKRAEEEEIRKEVMEKKEEEKKKEELSKNVGAWEGDDYEMGEQDWPSFVLLKGQSYHGVGKRRAPKVPYYIYLFFYFGCFVVECTVSALFFTNSPNFTTL